MKKVVKLVSILTLAIMITVSSFVFASAEENAPSDDEVIIITVTDDDNQTRAYELRWKYKEQDGHLWKRRWNATLGCWYDPAWILVY